MNLDIKAAVLGVNVCDEVLNLHYEVAYLRFLFNEVVCSKDSLKSVLNNEVFERARGFAEGEVRSRFPKVSCDFKKPTEINESESEAKSESASV